MSFSDCRKSLCLAKRFHPLCLALLILGRKTTLLSFHSGAAAPQSRLKCVTDTFIYAVTPTRAESFSASQKRLGRCPKPHKFGVLKGQSPFFRVSQSETMNCVRVWLTHRRCPNFNLGNNTYTGCPKKSRQRR